MRQAVNSLLFFKVRDHNMKLVANVTHKTPPIRFHFSDGIGYTFNMIPGKHAKRYILGSAKRESTSWHRAPLGGEMVIYA